MAAIEREEYKQPLAAGADGIRRGAPLALLKHGAAPAAPPTGARALPPAADGRAYAEAEPFEAQARSWRGLWRMCQIVRVLGTMSLYLFLNDYDIRAAFNARVAARRLEEAKGRGRSEYFRERARELVFHR